MALANALLIADVAHARHGPKQNAFHYGVYYLCFALSDLLKLRLPIVSLNRFNLFSFFETDHGNKKGNALSWIRSVLAEWNLHAADGEIILLTMPRLFGHVFNPVSFWFCLDKQNQLRAVLSEVTNTYHDRHSYLCYHDDHRPITQDDWLRAEKVFYVSPFLEIEGHYQFRFAYGERNIGVWIYYFKNDVLALTTSLVGKRTALTTTSLLRAFVRYPLVTLKVIGLIHYQALRLFFKGVRHYTHPLPPKSEISR